MNFWGHWENEENEIFLFFLLLFCWLPLIRLLYRHILNILLHFPTTILMPNEIVRYNINDMIM